jgi:hypothetical protein
MLVIIYVEINKQVINPTMPYIAVGFLFYSINVDTMYLTN